MNYITTQLAVCCGLSLKHFSWKALLAVVGVLLMTTPSSAGITTYTDQGAWAAAHGGVTVLEDFESADLGSDANDETTPGVFEDINSGPVASPVTFNNLGLSTSANFFNNGLIDVGDGSAPDGSTNGFFGFRSAINGNVVVGMNFLEYSGAAPNIPEFVELTLPPGVTAVSFIYRNGDNVGDGTTLSVDGVEIDGNIANHSGSSFDAFDPRYFAPQDSSRIPGGGAGTGPSFFGIYSDSGPISTIRFTAAEPPGGTTGTGTTSFNSFDDVRFEEPDFLTVRIDVGTGLTEILNDTVTPYDIDYYKISSSTDDLNFAGWNSLSDQSIDAIDGLDPDSIVGNGIGETWDEAGGSDDGVLSEAFLLGSSLFGTNRVESLGNAFKVGGDTDSLSFEYRRSSDGRVFNGVFEFVGTAADADFDGSGTVDGKDFLTWQRGFGLAGQIDNSNGDADGSGIVDGVDLAAWEAQFGGPPPLSGLAAATSVPEPTTGSLLALALATSLLSFRKRKTS